MQPLSHHLDPVDVEVHLPLGSNPETGELVTEAVLAAAVGPDTYRLLEIPRWSSDANLGDRVIALPNEDDLLELVEVTSRLTVARIVFNPLGPGLGRHLRSVARRYKAAYALAPCGCVVVNLFDPDRVAGFERFAARNSRWHSRWDYPPGPTEPPGHRSPLDPA